MTTFSESDILKENAENLNNDPIVLNPDTHSLPLPMTNPSMDVNDVTNNLKPSKLLWQHFQDSEIIKTFSNQPIYDSLIKSRTEIEIYSNYKQLGINIVDLKIGNRQDIQQRDNLHLDVRQVVTRFAADVFQFHKKLLADGIRTRRLNEQGSISNEQGSNSTGNQKSSNEQGSNSNEQGTNSTGNQKSSNEQGSNSTGNQKSSKDNQKSSTGNQKSSKDNQKNSKDNKKKSLEKNVQILINFADLQFHLNKSVTNKMEQLQLLEIVPYKKTIGPLTIEIKILEQNDNNNNNNIINLKELNDLICKFTYNSIILEQRYKLKDLIKILSIYKLRTILGNKIKILQTYDKNGGLTLFGIKKGIIARCQIDKKFKMFINEKEMV